MARRSSSNPAAAWTALIVALLVIAGSAPWLHANPPSAQAAQLHDAAREDGAGGSIAGAPRGGASLGAAVGTGARWARPAVRSRPSVPAFRPHLLVHVPRDIVARANPRAGARRIGIVPDGSKYYGVPTTAWVMEVSEDGRWGRVEVPYAWPRRDGWIRLQDLPRSRTAVEVRVDLSRHWIAVYKRDELLFGMPAATGASVSPTPVGRYFVTDRIPFSGGYLGSFAFGISGIQPKLPPGWSGGNQLAIHGTNTPSSIGTSASAGCLRVSEPAIDRLLPLLRLGTPVIVER